MSEVSANSSPVYNKIIISSIGNETTLVDFTQATAKEEDVIDEKTFYNNSSLSRGRLSASSGGNYLAGIIINPSETE